MKKINVEIESFEPNKAKLFKKFLKDNGVTEKNKDNFFMKSDENRIYLYKFIDTYKK